MKNNLSKATESELIAELQKRGYIRVLWQKGDIEERAKENGHDLTPEQIDNIAGNIERRHDCNDGLNWEILDAFIDMELEEAKDGN